MKKSLIFVFVIIALIIVLAGGYLLGTKSLNLDKTNQLAQSTITPNPTPTPTQSASQTGTIEGSLGFPSEGIPEDMRVCAEDIMTKQNFCTSQHQKENKYAHGVGYQLEVPAGSYHVYATVPGWENYRAYYNEFVTCGLSVNCPSHKPIEVEVSAGATLTGVDPQDWYNQ